MDFQTIIVAFIILAALSYAGKMLLGKIKAFSSDKSCAGDCGCGTSPKRKNLFTQINR